MNRKTVPGQLETRRAGLLVLCIGAAVATTIALLAISAAPSWSAWIVLAGCLAGIIAAGAWRRSDFWVPSRAQGILSSPGREFIVPIETPAPQSKFEGRSAELRALHEWFKSAPQDHPAIACIAGRPGIGKTELAIQYASLHRSSFPQGQIFTCLEHDKNSDSPVYEVLGHFLAALQLSDDSIPQEPGSRSARYSELTTGRRLLVILDNACHPDCVRQLLPNGQNCAAIITTRSTTDTLPPEVLSVALPINLTALSADDGIRLLESEIGPGGAESSHKLARTGHPLAIRLAAIALSCRPHWPLDQKKQDANDDNSVRTNLELIYWLLTPRERKALRCLAPLERPVFAVWELAALLEVDEADAIKLADNLARVDLVRRTSGGPAGIVRFEVNEQILPYLLERIPAETLAEQRADRLETLKRAHRIRAQREHETLLELVWERKEAGDLSAAFETIRAAVASAQENQQARLEALALATMADLRLEIGNIPGARELAQAARNLDEEQTPVRALRCLGVIACRQGDPGTGRELLDAALDLARRTTDAAEEIRTLIAQADVLAITLDTNGSLAAADLAVRLCGERDGCASMLPNARYGQARALLRCGFPHEAVACLDQAAAAASPGQRLVSAWIDLLRSEAALAAGCPEAAIKASSAAIDGFGEISHRYGVACSRLALAMAYAARGDDDLTEAVTSVSDALETLQNCDDPYVEREAKQLLASWLVRRGRSVRDRADLMAAAGLFEGLGDEVRARELRDEMASHRLSSRLRQLRSDRDTAQRRAS